MIELIVSYVIGAISVCLRSKGRWLEAVGTTEYGSGFINIVKKIPYLSNLDDSKLMISYDHPSKSSQVNVCFIDYAHQMLDYIDTTE